MTEKKGGNIAAYGLFAGAGAIGFVVLIFAMGGFGGGTQPGTIVCDLTGSINGRANDFVIAKDVKDVVISLDRTNCHEKGILEFSAVPNPTIPKADIFQGSVKIYVKVYDAANDLAASKEFTVTTNLGQGTPFTEALLFKGMVKGQTYTVQAFDSWEGNKIIGSKTITV